MKIQHLRNGIILVSVGLVFLFNNLGYVDWQVWETILSWWPVYLIALGWEIVFRNSKLKILALLSPLAFAFFILGPAWWQWEGKKESDLVKSSQWIEPISKKTKLVQADVIFRWGNLRLSGTEERKISADLEYDYSIPVWNFSEEEGIGKLSVTDLSRKNWGLSFGDKGVRYAGWGNGEKRTWAIGFDTTTPLELNLTSQVARNDLDFTQLKLKKLDICLQVGKAKIKLGEKSDTIMVNLEEKLAKVKLLVPKQSGISIKKDMNLAGLTCSNVSYSDSKENEFESPPSGQPVIFIAYEGDFSKLEIEGY